MKKIKKPELERPLQKIPIEELPNLFRPGTGTGTIVLDGDLSKFIKSDPAEEVFEMSDLDRVPKAVFQVEPLHPYALKQSKINGWVLLEWIITDRGYVKNVRVIQ